MWRCVCGWVYETTKQSAMYRKDRDTLLHNRRAVLDFACCHLQNFHSKEVWMAVVVFMASYCSPTEWIQYHYAVYWKPQPQASMTTTIIPTIVLWDFTYNLKEGPSDVQYVTHSKQKQPRVCVNEGGYTGKVVTQGERRQESMMLLSSTRWLTG